MGWGGSAPCTSGDPGPRGCKGTGLGGLGDRVVPAEYRAGGCWSGEKAVGFGSWVPGQSGVAQSEGQVLGACSRPQPPVFETTQRDSTPRGPLRGGVVWGRSHVLHEPHTDSHTFSRLWGQAQAGDTRFSGPWGLGGPLSPQSAGSWGAGQSAPQAGRASWFCPAWQAQPGSARLARLKPPDSGGGTAVVRSRSQNLQTPVSILPACLGSKPR